MTFRQLAKHIRASRAHTYASENADLYRGYDNGSQRAAEAIERLCDEWDAELAKVEYVKNFIPPCPICGFDARTASTHILGVKE